MIRSILASVVLLASASAALAQEDPDKEKVKKSILDKVRARIDEENRKILDRVAKIIDEELAKTPAVNPDITKKIAEIEKKLKDLDAQKADLVKQLEDLKKAAAAPPPPPPPPPPADEEAKIKADAKKKGPQDLEEAQALFEEALQEHNNADYKSSILKFKYIYYQFERNPLAATSAYNVACGYSLAGDKAKACDWLEISIKHGFNNYDHIRKDSDLDNIRQEKKYKQLLADK